MGAGSSGPSSRAASTPPPRGWKSQIVVDRNAAGDITSIKRRISRLQGFVGFGTLALILAILVGCIADDWSSPGPRDAMLFFYGVVMFVALGFGLRRLAQGRPMDLLIADREGVKFRLYPELGKVPWPDIVRFHYDDGGNFIFGARILYALLSNEETYGKKINWGSRFAPNKWLAPPFATIEGARAVDLAALKAALEELQAQVSGTVAPQDQEGWNPSFRRGRSAIPQVNGSGAL
jgi:hypothetical protein